MEINANWELLIALNTQLIRPAVNVKLTTPWSFLNADTITCWAANTRLNNTPAQNAISHSNSPTTCVTSQTAKFSTITAVFHANADSTLLPIELANQSLQAAWDTKMESARTVLPIISSKVEFVKFKDALNITGTIVNNVDLNTILLMANANSRTVSIGLMTSALLVIRGLFWRTDYASKTPLPFVVES